MEPAISYWETYKAKGDDKMILKCIDSGSKGNAYALIAEEEILLLEAGCRLMDVKKAIGFQIGKVVGCLVTHSHKDHIGYAKDILATGIKIYTNDETKQLVDSVHGERLYGKPEMKMFEVGRFNVTPFYVPHNDIPNYAYLIEHEKMGKLLFATDFEYLPWTFRQQRLNHMLIECNHMDDVENTDANYEHVMRGHSSLSTVLDVVRKNQTPCLRNVILCHLSHFNADPKQMLAEVEKVAGSRVKVLCAEAGLEVELRRALF